MSASAPSAGEYSKKPVPPLPNLSSTTNGDAPSQTQARAGLVPTNTVSTKEGFTVRARIEPTLAVDDVIRQLCLNLKLKDPPAMYALRDEQDELVTNDNLRKKIKGKVNLKYVSHSTRDSEDYSDHAVTVSCVALDLSTPPLSRLQR